MRKRWLGIPLPLVMAVVLSLTLIGGVVMGSYLFERHQSATVRVTGPEFVLFKDAACTIPLTSAELLDFGKVNPGASSAPVLVWASNIGDYSLIVTTNCEGLGADLTLWDLNLGQFAAAPDWTTLSSDLQAGWTIPLSLTVKASSSANGSSSFFINVKAVQKP